MVSDNEINKIFKSAVVGGITAVGSYALTKDPYITTLSSTYVAGVTRILFTPDKDHGYQLIGGMSNSPYDSRTTSLLTSISVNAGSVIGGVAGFVGTLIAPKFGCDISPILSIPAIPVGIFAGHVAGHFFSPFLHGTLGMGNDINKVVKTYKDKTNDITEPAKMDINGISTPLVKDEVISPAGSSKTRSHKYDMKIR